MCTALRNALKRGMDALSYSFLFGTGAESVGQPIQPSTHGSAQARGELIVLIQLSGLGDTRVDGGFCVIHNLLRGRRGGKQGTNDI